MMDTTMSYRSELEAVREGLRTADLDEAANSIGHAGFGVINRFEVTQAPESSDAEYVGSAFALLGTEASARLLVCAREDRLDSSEADAMIAGVGGALDAAQRCFAQRDTEGAQRFLEAALQTLGL